MDRRKENGGHSTKAKGVDKRKNEWKNAVEESVSYDDVKSLLTKAVQIGLSDKPDRLKAMQMVFDYTLGKPKESIDLNGQLGTSFDFKEIVSAIRGDK